MMIDDPADPSLHFQKLIDKLDRSIPVQEAWDFNLETNSTSKRLPNLMGQVLALSVMLKSMIPTEMENSSAKSLRYEAELLFDHIQTYMLSLERSFQELAVATIALQKSVEHLAENQWFIYHDYSEVVDIILHTVQDILYDYSGENRRASEAAFKHFHEFSVDLQVETFLDEMTKQKIMNATQTLAENWKNGEFIIRNFHYSLKAHFPIFYGNTENFEQFRLSASRLVKVANFLARMFSDKVYSVLEVLEKMEGGFDENDADFIEYVYDWLI